MGSKTYEGVRFSVYPNDYDPPHVHGTASGVTLALDLLPDRTVRLATRDKAVIPKNASRNIQAKIRRVATANIDDLIVLWEKIHGAR